MLIVNISKMNVKLAWRVSTLMVSLTIKCAFFDGFPKTPEE